MTITVTMDLMCTLACICHYDGTCLTVDVPADLSPPARRTVRRQPSPAGLPAHAVACTAGSPVKSLEFIGLGSR